MPIDTENIDTTPTNSGGGLSPIFKPGNAKIAIESVYLQKDADPEKAKKFGDRFIMRVRGEAIEGFKGVQIDKNDATKGHYDCQIGFVGFSRYGYRDHVTEGGAEYTREGELLKVIKTICDELNIGAWLKSISKKYDTIDQIVEAFDEDAPFKNIYFYACLSGREYMKDKYVNHELFLTPTHRTLGKGFSLVSDQVRKFFESEHIIRAVAKPATQNEPKSAEPQTAHLEPAKPAHQSNAELAFMNEGKKQAEVQQEQLEEHKEAKQEQPADIITGGDDTNPFMPWEEGFATWKPGMPGPKN